MVAVLRAARSDRLPLVLCVLTLGTRSLKGRRGLTWHLTGAAGPPTRAAQLRQRMLCLGEAAAHAALTLVVARLCPDVRRC